ncbi:FtsK/SpoIIIE domain-containing protein [Lentibacillus salicampi]|uniref:FtsK domain-containing protein n=1 Tax=Lentibacillus salicampi TaxID=175306 RepID=A0A4Y9A7S5_9BACI|nr:FtsK/SpoIIIE domain-containing protein [Lentibacillus salicampi]TFJ91826.1 hypothetical protein E4U82_15740 [Lentibacillus salicampi]
METIIGAGIALFTMYAADRWKKSDAEKIQHTFKNIGYAVGDHEPRLFKKHKTDGYTLYTYHVPFGLIDDDKLQVLEKVLNKPVKISFTNQKLQIKVYKNKMPVKVEYDWNKTDGWTVPMGQSQERFILHDFDKIPHMTIAGMTRQGKTVLLKLILAHLINNHSDDAEFMVIDLKGGLEFNQYRNLKQMKSVASNVSETKQALSDVLNQIESDMSHYKEKGYTNVLDTNISKRKFIIVDEAAELVPPGHLSKDEKKPYSYCQHALSEIARIAGALGYRLIFCTQYPTADTLPRQIKQNADAKVSFRLPTEIASRVAIDEQGAESIANIGRAIYRTSKKHIVQVPYVENIKERLGDHFVSPTTEEDAEGRADTVQFG